MTVTLADDRTEAKVRKVVCPVCKSAPGRPCADQSGYSHTGRYWVAVDRRLVKPFPGGWRGVELSSSPVDDDELSTGGKPSIHRVSAIHRAGGHEACADG